VKIGWVTIKEEVYGYFCCARWLHGPGHPQREGNGEPRRAFKEMAKNTGITIKDIYWTRGRHDLIAICEVPDGETVTALSLSVSSRGNMRAETLRAFSFNEVKRILGRMV